MENIESKYFIDDETFNCPFCKIRGVKYVILGIVRFDETKEKELNAAFVECSKCHKISMHLSKISHIKSGLKFLLLNPNEKEYSTYSSGALCRTEDKISFLKVGYFKEHYWYYTNFTDSNGNKVDIEIDQSLILNIPTSFFTIDNRIPKQFRELINEAEKCISNNCLTGASACIRKTIYEFINKEKLEGSDYTAKIKSLKGKYNTLDDTYVDILSAIQGITSDQVHEQAYTNFDIQHTKIYIEVLKEVFNQIYVIPDELKSKQTKISSLYNAIKKDKVEKKKH